MRTPQAGILLTPPRAARYLSFALAHPAQPSDSLRRLRDHADGEQVVVGFGGTLVSALDAEIPGLRSFPALAGAGVDFPATPAALWLWLRGDDRGEVLHRARLLERAVAPAFRLVSSTDAFLHAGGRDLSGFEDGTENPTGEQALATAIIDSNADPLLGGSSFVAVQRWRHDFPRLDRMGSDELDLAIGRRRSDNQEIEDAPESAHVKRTAQESFDPVAFVLRRSMPWSEGDEGGLMFVAFATSFAPFEAQLRRMAGTDDGITDALFKFSRPESGAYYWCPAIADERLDLAPLGL